MKRIGFVLILAVLAASAYAQQGQVAGPVVGYVFDGSAHALRPVLGIPGASILGSPLALGYDLTWATVSPGGDSAVAMAGDGSVHLLRLAAGQATESALNGASAPPNRAVFSPSGKSVALVGTGRAQVFTGLPDAPTLAGSLDLGSAGARQVQAQAAQQTVSGFGSMALSDDGALLLFVANGAVHLAGAGGPHSFDTAGRVAVVAFAAGGHDAVLATRHGATVLHSIDTTATQQPLAPASPLDSIAGAAFSADGKTLFVAGGQNVVAFDLTTGNPTAIACSSVPTGLMRMGNVYRLNELGSGPLWVLDPLPNHQRIVFVPATGGSE